MKKLALPSLFLRDHLLTLWNFNAMTTETQVAKNQPTERRNSDEASKANRNTRQLEYDRSLRPSLKKKPTISWIASRDQTTTSPMEAKSRPLVAESNYMQKIEEITLEVIEFKKENPIENELGGNKLNRFTLQ